MTFDEVLKLIKKFDESSLAEIVYDAGDTSLTLKKSGEPHPVYTQPMVIHPQAAVGVPAAGTPAAAATPAAVAGAAPATSHPPHDTGPTGGDTPGGNTPDGSAPPAPTPTESDVEVITSPIVGTFYRAPAPDSPAFCQEGDVVHKGKTLCILEAMKVMNELEAEFTMEIVAFKVNSGDVVEYGTPLVEVRRV